MFCFILLNVIHYTFVTYTLYTSFYTLNAILYTDTRYIKNHTMAILSEQESPKYKFFLQQWILFSQHLDIITFGYYYIWVLLFGYYYKGIIIWVFLAHILPFYSLIELLVHKYCWCTKLHFHFYFVHCEFDNT